MGRFAFSMLICLFWCCALCSLPAQPAGAQMFSSGSLPFFPPMATHLARKPQVVRIGLLEAYGFFHSRDNALRGYMPALFESMGQLAGWKVEWVSVTLDSLEEDFAKGRIDLACGVSWTSERARQFQYSSIRAGMYATTLRVPQNSHVHYMDFAEFNGLRIGFFEKLSNLRIFERQAKMYGFSYTPVL